MNPFGGRISVVAIPSGPIVPRIANPLPEAAWVATYFGVTSIWDVDSATGLQRFGACWSLAMRALLVMSRDVSHPEAHEFFSEFMGRCAWPSKGSVLTLLIVTPFAMPLREMHLPDRC